MLILIDVNGVLYRAAINANSVIAPNDLQVYQNKNFNNPITDLLKDLPDGKYDKGNNLPKSLEIDFTTMNLIPNNEAGMQITKMNISGVYNDIDDYLATIASIGLKSGESNDATIYIFGECWFDQNQTDNYFKLTPSAGIHNIHMNQHNVSPYNLENGSGQDGCIFVKTSPSNFMAFFTKFQTQTWPKTNYNNIFFTEALANAPVDATDEWIKLVNLTNSSVDLSGWTIVENSSSFVFPFGTTIDVNKKLVIAKNLTGFKNLYGVAPDLIWSSLALGNNSDVAELKNAAGVVVDRLIYGNTVNDTSLIRKKNADGKYILNLNIDDWETGTLLGKPLQL